MIKSIVLDNGDVIDYIDDINNATPQFVGKNIIYELTGSYNPTDQYLTFKEFKRTERTITEYNSLRTKHQEYWEFQCQFLIFTKHIITMEG